MKLILLVLAAVLIAGEAYITLLVRDNTRYAYQITGQQVVRIDGWTGTVQLWRCEMASGGKNVCKYF